MRICLLLFSALTAAFGACNAKAALLTVDFSGQFNTVRAFENSRVARGDDYSGRLSIDTDASGFISPIGAQYRLAGGFIETSPSIPPFDLGEDGVLGVINDWFGEDAFFVFTPIRGTRSFFNLEVRDTRGVAFKGTSLDDVAAALLRGPDTFDRIILSVFSQFDNEFGDCPTFAVCTLSDSASFQFAQVLMTEEPASDLETSAPAAAMLFMTALAGIGLCRAARQCRNPPSDC